MRRSLVTLGSIVVLGWAPIRAQTLASKGTLIEIRAVRKGPAPGFRLQKSVNDSSFYLADTALLSDDDLQEVRTDTSALNPGLLILNVRMKPSAAARVHEFTERHVGDSLAVLVNGELSGTPAIIRDPISGPLFTISVRGSQRFAAAVAARWPTAH